MGLLDVETLSDRYRVRMLRPEDVEEVYALCLTNPLFYRVCGTSLTREGILDDMVLLPPGKTPADKYFLGFYDGGALAAVLDLVLGYPNTTTAFIGFFMVEESRSRQGVGTAIIHCLCARLRALGMGAVRLAYERGNPQAAHFWTKNHFLPIGEKEKEEGGVLVLGERRL